MTPRLIIPFLASLILFAIPVASAVASTLDRWQELGPYGATIVAAAIDPGTPDRQIAGGFAGLFRSVDGGATWARAAAELAGFDFSAAIFTATSDLFVGTFAHGVHRSTDGGVTFVATNTGIEQVAVAILYEDPAARLWAGTYGNGLFISTDGGAQWEARSSGIDGLQINGLICLGADTLLVATGSSGQPGGVFRTTDAGVSWVASSTGLTNLEVASLAWHPTGGVIFAGTVHSSTVGGVYRSTDGGATWTASVTGLTNRNIAELLVDAANPARVYAGTQPLGGFTQSGVFLSTDAGLSWALTPGSPPVNDVRVLVQRIDDGRLLAGVVGQTAVRGGLYSSADGLDWQRRDQGLTVLRCQSLATNPFEPDEILVGTTGDFTVPRGVYRTLDLGVSWEENTSSGMHATILSLVSSPVVADRHYAGTSSGLYRWREESGVWVTTPLAGRRIEDLLLLPSAGDFEVLWAATSGGLFRSLDHGDTWEDRSANLGMVTLTAVTVDPGNSEIVYAGSDTGGVYESFDAGGSWLAANTNLGSLTIRDLVFDESGALLAATDDGVYQYDAGSWIDDSSGLGNFDVRDLAVYRGERFAATAAGVYRSSTALGTPWELAGDPLPNPDVLALHLDVVGDQLRVFAGTAGGGVYVADELVPVEIAEFEGVGEPGRVELRFRSATERDHLGFHIERRLEGETEFVARTSSLLRGGPEYRFVDRDARLRAGRVVDYRLLAIALDGSEERHGPYRIVIEAGAPVPVTRLLAAPNPFATTTTIRLPDGGGSLRIVNVEGRVVRRVQWSPGETAWPWDGLDAGGRRVPAGVYWLELQGPAGSNTARVVRLPSR